MSHDQGRLPHNTLSLDATCQANGHSTPVHLTAISQEGCRAETDANRTSVGEKVVLKLDEYVSLLATVEWVRTGEIGLAFRNPLHGAMLIEFARKAIRANPNG